MMADAAMPMPAPAHQPPVTPRVGSPRRAAILTALASAAVRDGNLKAVLILARTGRPRSLLTCAGRVRWLALAGLRQLYPDANAQALRMALGCRPSTDRRGRALAEREDWPQELVARVARETAENEDAHLTASWIWPHACAVAAGHTGADPAAVSTVTGSRASQPRAVSLARQIAVYLTRTEGDVNATAIAAATGLNKETVRHASASIEDRRDEDGALDEALTALAAALGERLDAELGAW